ncbi:ABC transporter substrate-binding protein [Meridianimarinicoccus aquatilis]|uniref:ABC transporter substrate-binding protein n=1 Tax=Meridianimarinicoccus aquatilis TaxID=2552766 RepID=A0A4R6B3B4_9RHOB|nr:ABC transporter substrate-binding protein [Fluviibacterium aquatile]TDL90802.1 ABC transporter substrate-binding protein [Fluviibacterium aquatile]
MTIRHLMLTSALTLVAAPAFAACPLATVADPMGLTSAYPQQFELEEFQTGAACELEFSENPAIGDLNGRILGNDALPAVAERLPAEALVVMPYDTIGQYGGVITGLSKATESGTSDLLSVRHVNFVRYTDDLQTVVPNIAKAWSWNDDFTELTISLRAGHKWSDGAPFTAADVEFWMNDIILNPDVYEKTPDRWLFAGEPVKVEAVDDVTVKMTFPVPTPGILNRFAVDFGQPFQPKHFLGQFMPKYNEGAEALAQEYGFENAAAAVDFYYGGSDWKDVPSPLLKDADKAAAIGRAVVPTLESYIVVDETSEGRKLVANPYFHMVDTAGNQLPYISEIVETYVGDKEVQNLKVMNGEVVWKQQAVFLEDFPLLKDNEAKGNYTIQFAPTLGENVFFSFNRTHKDEVLREIFNDIRFNRAMSLAMNRDEINEIVYLGQGTPMQGVPAEPKTVSFIDDETLTKDIAYDVDGAKALLAEMGLTDADGDGTLERPDGKPLVIRLVYSSQGVPVKMMELIRDYWSAVGVRIDVKEVTSDEYRASGNNNDLDLTTWKYDGNAGPTISQDVTVFVPPFGDFFNPGTGFEWASWKKTDGAEGIEPPADILKLWDLSEQFLQVQFGSEESDAIGAEIVKIHTDNMLKIGTVGDIVAPFLYRNDLQNVKPITSKTYDFYWTYPYRPQQWWLAQ